MILNGYFGNSFNEKEQVITLTLELTVFSSGQRREMMKDCLVVVKQGVMLQKTDTIVNQGTGIWYAVSLLSYLLPLVPVFPCLLFFG